LLRVPYVFSDLGIPPAAPLIDAKSLLLAKFLLNK
jgi:hypothetical protein